MHRQVISPSELADAFASVIKSRVNVEYLEVIDLKNKTTEGCCATHDFCDANQAMLDAMTSLGIELDIEDKEQVKLINAAWSMAKKRGFSS